VEDFIPVQKWMKPFASIVEEMPDISAVRHFKGIPKDDAHNIQTKAVELVSLVSIIA